MASDFIGLQMRVVLREPPGYTLLGTVRDVVAGTSLSLANVFVEGTKDWMPQYVVDATQIAELHHLAPAKPPQPPPPQLASTPIAKPTAPPVTKANPQFVDPAIMSMGRPGSGKPPARIHGTPPAIHAQTPPRMTGQKPQRQQLTPSQNIAESLNHLQLADVAHELDSGHAENIPPGGQAKKSKRRTRQKPSKAKHTDDELTTPKGTTGRGKGWRQTPMLQSTSSFQPFHSLKKSAKKGTVDNGWASEDVTEEMGEFDFINNLAKFDKQTIFEEMQKEDEVDEANRLVTHNRRAKPGTAGGKNLAYDENVLDLPSKNADFWNSEADDALEGAERVTNGRGPFRADNKTILTRRSQSRKASASLIQNSQPLSRVNSAQQGRLAGLYLTASDTRLEAISTLQMLNLENIAANELGFTEELMAENAGRGIAEVAVRALEDPAMKIRYELAGAGASSQILRANSTVVILGGNNKSSIRALAAARHLRNKNIDVQVCLVGIERERDLLEDLRRQITLYRNFGGKVMSKNDFFEHLRKTAAAGTQKTSVSLIIDALLGLTISFEELRVGDQATVYELMEWANRNEAFVLSVDVPTGIDPANGKTAIIDGAPLFIKPRYVVSIAAPKRGLLEAVTPLDDDTDGGGAGGVAEDDEWRLFVTDIGFGAAVWRKAGTKIRRGVDFDGKWVLEMRYRTSSRGDEDAGISM